MVGRGMGVSLLNMRPASGHSVEGLPYQEVEIAGDVEPARIVASWPKHARLTRRAEAVLDAARSIQVVKNSSSPKETHVKAS